MPFGEIFKTANDRLKSPFLSSFIFSWIAFNWKAIFVAFAGDENVYTKINCIESDYIDFYSSFLYPLLVSLFYTLAFPFITVFFQWVTEKARIWASRLKYQREILESEDKEALAKIEFRLEQARSGTNDLNELNNQISKLKEDLNKESLGKQSSSETIIMLNQKITDFKKNQTQLEKDLKESEKKIESTNSKFLNWFKTDKTGNSTLKDFYSIRDDNQYNPFKVIISTINSKKNTLVSAEKIPEEIQYFIDKGLVNTTRTMSETRTKSEAGTYITFKMTSRGSKLSEFMEYYEPPF